MKITGELLKTERVNQGLTIQQVAQALKLNQKMIIALESGDSSQLPAKTFIRGFVKSYAQHLKLDSDAVLRQFQEEMGSTSPLPKVPPPINPQPDGIKVARPALRQNSNYSQDKSITSKAIREQDLTEKHFNNKILFFLVGAAVLVIVIVTATRFIEDVGTPTPTSPEITQSTDVITPNYTNETPEALKPSADLTVAAASPSSTDAAVSMTTTTNPETPQITQGTIETPAATATQPNVIAEVVSLPDDDIPPSTGKPIELVLEAKRDIEIMYARGNTRQFKSLKLVANKIQIIRSATGLHLKANDGGAFKITANGIDKGVAGAANKPVKISF